MDTSDSEQDTQRRQPRVFRNRMLYNDDAVFRERYRVTRAQFRQLMEIFGTQLQMITRRNRALSTDK